MARIAQIISGMPATDSAGVELNRVIGQTCSLLNDGK